MLSDEEDSDKEGEQGENAEERIAHELFEGQGEEGDEDLDDVASQRRATEKEFEDLNVEGSEEESGWFFHHLNNLSRASQRLEKYLNIQGCLVKSLKIQSALKSIGKSLKGLEKSLKFSIYFRFNTVDGDLNQYRIGVPLFGAAFAAPNKATAILYLFPNANFFSISVLHS